MSHIKLKFHWFVLFGMMCVCSACPYESPVPISDAHVPIDSVFLGKWTKSNASNDFFEVRAQNKFTYLIHENVFNRTKKIHKLKKYYAHLSQLNDEFFLNVSPRDSSEKAIRDDFLLYKIEKVDSVTFNLVALSDYIDEKFKTSADLQKFIKKHTHLSFFYGNKSSFKRFDHKNVEWKN